ncbi:choice-of-anchor K domain-containing protein [Planctomycetota bacterium]|nr:choice-of-anchor K domain-containing protein [Planctomycetota bacterium]
MKSYRLTISAIVACSSIALFSIVSAQPTYAASVSGQARTSSLDPNPSYDGNQGSTYTRNNYRELTLGESSSAASNNVDELQSFGSNTSFSGVDVGEVFQVGEFLHFNGEDTADGTTPETLRTVVRLDLASGENLRYTFFTNYENNAVDGADVFSIPFDTSISDESIVTIDGEEYILQIVGFGTSADNISSSIVLGDLGTETAFNSYGRLISYDDYLNGNIAVPTPAAALMALSVLPILLLRRQHKTTK